MTSKVRSTVLPAIFFTVAILVFVCAAIFGIISLLTTAMAPDPPKHIPIADRDSLTKAPHHIVQPVVLKNSGYRLDFGDLTTDSIGYQSMKVLITPLKGQTGYGELRCAFYNTAHHLVATNLENWSGNPEATPIEKSMDFLKPTGPIASGVCWIKNGLGDDDHD